MAKTNAQQRATNKYNKEHYKYISLALTKEKKEEFIKALKAKGITQSQYLKECIDKLINE